MAAGKLERSRQLLAYPSRVPSTARCGYHLNTIAHGAHNVVACAFSPTAATIGVPVACGLYARVYCLLSRVKIRARCG